MKKQEFALSKSRGFTENPRGSSEPPQMGLFRRVQKIAEKIKFFQVFNFRKHNHGVESRPFLMFY